jgi:hypothetical protein
MDRRSLELMILVFLSGFLCSLALLFDRPLVAAVFAALASGTIVFLRRFYS